MKFSIIIPTYNSAEFLKNCIESIIKYTDTRETEIIVVANGCTDGTESYLGIKANLGQVSIIWEAEAIGYPKAINQGIKEARGEFIVLLNDDTELLPQPINQWLNILYEPFKNRQDKVGISGPQMMSKEESLNIDFMCFFCVMLRKEMIDEIGMLDEIFSPGYSEDIDYSFRAMSKGWKVVQVPNDERPFYDELKRTGNFPMYHVGTQTFSRKENQDEELIIRNNKIIQDRWADHFDGFKDVVVPEREGGTIPEIKVTPMTEKSFDSEINRDVYFDEPPLYGLKMDGTAYFKDSGFTELKMPQKKIDISRAQKIDGFMADSELQYLAELATTSKIFIEVGSWHGKSTAAIVDNLPEGAVLFCVDTWKGSANEQDTSHASARQNDGDHAYLEFLKSHINKVMIRKIIPLRMNSDNAATLLESINAKADAIFIDAEHTYDAVLNDIHNWQILLAEGGVICGHDYGTDYWPEVTKAVDNFYFERKKVRHVPNTSIWEVKKRPTLLSEEEPFISNSKKPERVTPCVFDCIPFNNELDILEMRLTELYDVVDRFIIVEAKQTHSGMDKPLYFHENYMRFEKFLSKITHLVIEEFPNVDPDNPHWSREGYQRDYAMRGLKDCIATDVIISCDCDEIPTISAIAMFKEIAKDGVYRPFGLEMNLYYYNMHTRAELIWTEGRISTFKIASELGLTNLRYKKDVPTINNAGVHLSYFGSAKDIVRKIEATAHQEYNHPLFKNVGRIQERMNKGEDVFGRSEVKFKIIDVNTIQLPKWFEENKDNEKIKKYL